MRKELYFPLLVFLSSSIAAQTKNSARTVLEGQMATLTLASGVTTTIRLPEAVTSVIVGDSNLFHAEYSPSEPLLVFVKPVISNAAQSNLVISTVGGRHFVLLLRSAGSSSTELEAGIDVLVTCRPGGGFFIEDSFPTAVIS